MNLPLKASMDFGCNTPKRTCMIRNISESGACLHIGLLLDPPEYFDLKISSVGNFCRHCKLVWRSEFDIGVKFVPHNDIPSNSRDKPSSWPADSSRDPEIALSSAVIYRSPGRSATR
jgi:hypothetical protein